ncbi:MAG: hypothetical protein ABJ370_14405 [Paracoccaceae bacterium]
MSDLMTNAEVEDVLSSIRRLVSEEERVAPAKEGGGSTSSVDRLILTPAQLITPVNETADPDSEEHVSDLDVEPDHEDSTVFLLQDAQKKPHNNKSLGDESGAAVSILNDDGDQGTLEDDVTVPENFEFNADVENERLDLISDEEPGEVDQVDISSLDEVKSVFSEDDVAPDDVTADDAEMSDLNDDETLSNHHSVEVDDISTPEETSSEDELAESENSGHSLGDKVATLETLIASRGDQWEPDTTGQSDYAAKEYPSPSWTEDAYQGAEILAKEDDSLAEAASIEAPASEQTDDLARAVGDMLTAQPPKEGTSVLDEHVQAQPMQLGAWNVSDEAPFEYVASDDEDQMASQGATIAGASASGLGQAGSDVFSADEELLDEAVLREMIADIVREELQGALGERITRNVRKLVRREIHRALASQDLD